MASKPAHLTPHNAAAFQEQSVVDVYHLRLPYPPELFTILLSLTERAPEAVLDVGAGAGELARPLAERVQRVDAVDISPAMVQKGRLLPGGGHPRLRWIVAPVERAELQPPYDLIVAGDSIHWMEWEVIFPRFARMLAERGVVALVERYEASPPWGEGLGALIRRCSTMQEFQPYDLVEELERRRLFRVMGKRETAPVTAHQPVEDYIASFHSRASLSRQRMAPDDARAFDEALRDLVQPWSRGGAVELRTVASVVWARPTGGS